MQNTFLRFAVIAMMVAGLLTLLSGDAYGTLITHASEAAVAEEGGGGHGVGKTFLWLGIILAAAALAKIVDKKGQPEVLGELGIGVLLGNAALIGISIFEPMKNDQFINFLAQLGVGVLLFKIGLESDLAEMRRVGGRAFTVAVAGVVTPFAMGYFVGQWLIPGLPSSTYLFIGATLTATSVAITGKVFSDMGRLRSREAQIILGAAVIDDVLGLLILAVVSAIVTTGTVGAMDILLISGKAFLFLAGSVFLGRLLAPRLSKLFSVIHTGHGMKLTVALLFFLFFAYGAELVGLAPIVGAFAAGLVLDAVHFARFKGPELAEHVHEHLSGQGKSLPENVKKHLEHARHAHLESLVNPLVYALSPVFFVLTGMHVDLSILGDGRALTIALALTAVAIIGKLACGLVTGKEADKWIVGFGMAPRGEVGLIFANMGLALGVMDATLFSSIVIVVMLTTLGTPFILAMLLEKQKRKESSSGNGLAQSS